MRNCIVGVLAAWMMIGCYSEAQPTSSEPVVHKDGESCKEQVVTGSSIPRYICRDDRADKDDHDEQMRGLETHNQPVERH
jgi:hypothetical protein